jgi:hypothetical protein
MSKFLEGVIITGFTSHVQLQLSEQNNTSSSTSAVTLVPSGNGFTYSATSPHKPSICTGGAWLLHYSNKFSLTRICSQISWAPSLTASLHSTKSNSRETIQEITYGHTGAKINSTNISPLCPWEPECGRFALIFWKTSFCE